MSRNRVINTTRSIHAAPSNPDVNTPLSNMEDEGEFIDGYVNEGGNPGLNDLQEDATDTPEETGTRANTIAQTQGELFDSVDHTPAVHTVTISFVPGHGAHHPSHTDIVARVCMPNGYQNKRLVLPGQLTARSLGAHLANVAAW